jgi:hypothetical protein
MLKRKGGKCIPTKARLIATYVLNDSISFGFQNLVANPPKNSINFHHCHPRPCS